MYWEILSHPELLVGVADCQSGLFLYTFEQLHLHKAAGCFLYWKWCLQWVRSNFCYLPFLATPTRPLPWVSFLFAFSQFLINKPLLYSCLQKFTLKKAVDLYSGWRHEKVAYVGHLCWWSDGQLISTGVHLEEQYCACDCMLWQRWC